ncbi:MAG TPA: efflux RND transporter periplasmic adaptor subunit [Rhizomicrobium sp.]|nr:efflux RND transporter periplasmic adaptor subunit [Rhizomicrobium sp.]
MNLRLPEPLQTVPAAVQSFPETVRQANTRTRLIWSAAGIAIIVLLAWWVSGLFSAPPPPKVPDAPVRVAQAARQTVIINEHTVGTIIANATVAVTAQVSGQIVAVKFKEGDIVKKGDVLFQLDPRPLQAAYNQAVATTKRDEATLVSDKKDAIRYTTLQKLGAASGQQTDQAVAAAGAMAATVVADKAAADAAKLNLVYSTVRSPVDGKTGPILIQIGNLVAANQTNPLVTIAQIHPVKVSFFLPQTDLPRIQQRMAQHKMQATIHVQGQGGDVLTAPVDFVSNAVSDTTGTIELRATFANLDNVLVPGQLADTTVSLGEIDNATVVPHDAINQGPDGSYVWVVDKNMQAQMRAVTVLNDDGTTAAVQGPVKVGDRVITEGALRVVQGTKVAIKKNLPGNPQSTTQAPAGAQ